MAGWYRKFIKNFSHIAKPLYELTKKNAKWEWTDACEKAFITIRDALTQYPVLRAPNPNKDYILETDASDEALSATILQYDENNDLHPIAYASKTLNDAQRNYTVTDREALAIVWGLEHFKSFCEGHRYTAVTDHAALRYLYTAKNKTPRLHRLLLRLQPYEVKLHYRAGKDNHAADLLSRSQSYMEMKDDVNVHAITTRSRKRNTASKKQWNVERILARRPIAGRADEYEYEVKWKGYDDSDNTWEPLINLSNASEYVAEFEQRLSALHRPSSKPDSDEDNDDNIAEDPLMCDVCHVLCTNNTDLHVHRYREHKIPIPTPSYDVEEVNTELLRSLQRSEPQFRVIFESRLGELDVPQATKHENRMLSSYEFVLDVDDLLYCVELPGVRTKSKVRTQLRLCLPKQFRQQMMKEIHEGVFAAHPGVVHMYDKLREYAWWPHMLNDIVQYVKACDVCQRSKSRKVHVAPQRVHIPTGPWTYVGLDWVGPLPKTDRGNEYILVSKCMYIKYVEAFAAADIGTKTTARLVIDGVICRYGLPLCFTSDRGAPFVSQLAGAIYKELGIKQSKTTSYHPQSNGNVEIFNKLLKQTLKLWANERQSDWDLLLPYAVFAYNTAYHSLLQETPFYLQFGRDARLTADIIIGKRPQYTAGVHEYATELVQNLYDVHTRVRDILKNVNDERDVENVNVPAPKYNIGDEVLLYDPTTKKGLSRKLVQRWKGPYIIIEQHSAVTYAIMKDGHKQIVHVERLRKKNVFDDGRHDDALLTVEDELRCIEEAQHQLLQRHRQATNNKQIIKAAITSQSHLDHDGDVVGSDEAMTSEFTYLNIHDDASIQW